MTTKRVTSSTLQQMKDRGQRMTLLTAYDCLFAELVDSAGIDMILVGDSLGMVVMGYETTVPVTLEQMIHHTQAVSRAVRRAMVIADMPFGSFEASDTMAIQNAQRLVKEGGAQAVKVEGGNRLVRERVDAIVSAGVPVMGHLGLTPQTASLSTGFRVQGRDAQAAREILQQAAVLADLGTFAVLLECVPVEVAEKVATELSVPVIGIGAGAACDGQALVTQDMLGLYGDIPRHSAQYANLRETIEEALFRYRREVDNGQFPAEENTFHSSPTQLDEPDS